MKNPFKSLENQIKKGINKLGDEVRGGINDLGGQVRNSVNQVGNEVKGGLQQAGGEIRNGVLVAGEEAKKGVYSASKEVQDAFEKELPTLLEKVLSELVSEGIKPALKAQAKLAHTWADGMDAVAERAPAMVDEINKVGFDVELKVNVEINLEYENFWTRAREVAGILDRYGNDGIALRRRDIRGFITAMGPDTINFGAGASLSLGLDIGGVGKMKSISLALFIELSDYILEEMGVPE